MCTLLKMRFFLSLFVALLLLTGQQEVAVHALRHVLAEQAPQPGKKSQHTNDCELCISYAQLGSALATPTQNIALLTSLGQSVVPFQRTFSTHHPVQANARGPPASPQLIS